MRAQLQRRPKLLHGNFSFKSFGILDNISSSFTYLSRGIATVGKDGLPGNPAALVAEEANKRRNVRDFSQSAAQALALVECNCFIRLLWVEKCYH